MPLPLDSIEGCAGHQALEHMRGMSLPSMRARDLIALYCVSHRFVHDESTYDVSGRTYPPPIPTVKSDLYAFEPISSIAARFTRFLAFYSSKTGHKCRQNSLFAYLPHFKPQKIWQKCRKNDRFCGNGPRGDGLNCATDRSLKSATYRSGLNLGGAIA